VRGGRGAKARAEGARGCPGETLEQPAEERHSLVSDGSTHVDNRLAPILEQVASRVDAQAVEVTQRSSNKAQTPGGLSGRSEPVLRRADSYAQIAERLENRIDRR
jgi:hypothetical protein